MKKILAVDIGNSNIVIGCFSGETLLFTFRIPTMYAEDGRTLLSQIESTLSERLTGPGELTGSVISSVVPNATRTMRHVLEQLTGKMPLIARASLETGIDLSHYDKESLGVDRLADMVAAKRLYGAPFAVFDLGTATTLSILDRHGAFRGGMITPGVQLSLLALHEHTAKLPLLKAGPASGLIGRDTAGCMRTGSIISTACVIDGMAGRIAEELRIPSIPIVLTGGLGKIVVPWCRTKVHFEPNLLLIGLQILYDMNVGKEAEKP